MSDITTWSDLDTANKADGHYNRQPSWLVAAGGMRVQSWKSLAGSRSSGSWSFSSGGSVTPRRERLGVVDAAVESRWWWSRRLQETGDPRAGHVPAFALIPGRTATP